jgi:hypothetical protein
MNSEPPAWVRSNLSLPRFAPYVRAAVGDHDVALRLYWWNIEVSGALLRNRIMRHEPIHHRDLAADHRKIYRLLGYPSPDVALAAKALDRVPEVLARGARRG